MLPVLLAFPGDSLVKVLPRSKALAGEATACADLRDCEVPELPAFSDADAPAVVGMLGAKQPLFPRAGAAGIWFLGGHGAAAAAGVRCGALAAGLRSAPVGAKDTGIPVGGAAPLPEDEQQALVC